jgi:ABC-type cobalamin transport system permease subunit
MTPHCSLDSLFRTRLARVLGVLLAVLALAVSGAGIRARWEEEVGR